MKPEPIAVVVFQLGGPDSLQAVEPFLYNLFSDPDIIDFPFARLARSTLARLISSRRARHVQEHYASIGGKSPIRELTELQARALERHLRESHGLDARVIVAMRYWHPLTDEAVEQVQRGGFRKLVLLPLYPQYSKTTTGSSLNEWRRHYSRAGKDSIPASVIEDYHDHPPYLDAVVEKINQGLARFAAATTAVAAIRACHDERKDRRPPPVILSASEESAFLSSGQVTADPSSAGGRTQGDKPRLDTDRSGPASIAATEDVHLVFSAHGVPVRFIEAGDPYQQQIEETTRLVMARGGWRNPHVLCYQSRVNPGKWLEPSLSDALRSLAVSSGSGHLQVADTSHGGLKAPATGAAPRDRASGGSGPGAPRVLVIPISFVTDHVETLAEIDIEARQLAGHLGIEQFELMPALNDSPAFIRALADLVLTHTGITNTYNAPMS